MKVSVAECKGTSSVRESKVSSQQPLETASVLFLCLTHSQDTENLISATEFAAMRRSATLVNVAWGGKTRRT